MRSGLRGAPDRSSVSGGYSDTLLAKADDKRNPYTVKCELSKFQFSSMIGGSQEADIQ